MKQEKYGANTARIGMEVLSDRHDVVSQAEMAFRKRFEEVDDPEWRGGFVGALRKFMEEVDDHMIFFESLACSGNTDFMDIDRQTIPTYAQGTIEATAFLLFVVSKNKNADVRYVKKIIWEMLEGLMGKIVKTI